MDSGGNLSLLYPLGKLVGEQETVLNQQGPLFERKGKAGEGKVLMNTHTIFQLHMRQQVKEIPFADGENMRRLLSRTSDLRNSPIPKEGLQVVNLYCRSTNLLAKTPYQQRLHIQAFRQSRASGLAWTTQLQLWEKTCMLACTELHGALVACGTSVVLPGGETDTRTQLEQTWARSWILL